MSGVFVIKGGTVIDETGTRRADVGIKDGVITDVGNGLDVTGATVVDASGCVVSPGLVDIHVHLREPGREEAETIETGARAAALGGFTAVVAMPNTEPTTDDISVVRQVQRTAHGKSCDVAPAAAITRGRKGEQLTNMAELASAGVRLFTDDGTGVQDTGLMRRAMEYATMLDVTIASHCEDASLSRHAHMHEGAVSSLLGINGIPTEAEELMVMRDLALARKTGARLHLMHLSTAGSIAMVEAVRAQGVNVTAEVAPQHFTLTDDEIRTFDSNLKMYPPLRPDTHRDAIKRAVEHGVVDVIATDHAPHAPYMKDLPFEEAERGMIGLETSFAIALTMLHLPIEKILALMSWQPARIARLDSEHGGPIAAGRPANITVIDPEARWVVEPDRFASKSRNTPFAGRKLRGRVRNTFLRGEPTVLNGEATR